MAEGIRTDDGKRVWVVKREDSGGQESYSFIRPAEDDDVQGHTLRHGISPDGDDTKGQGGRFPPLGETDEDVEGHRTRFHLSPESIDTEQGLYLAVVDTEDDVTGQGWRHILAPEAADIEA